MRRYISSIIIFLLTAALLVAWFWGLGDALRGSGLFILLPVLALAALWLIWTLWRMFSERIKELKEEDQDDLSQY